MEEKREFEILEHRWGDFVKRMAKLNRRAAKLGCKPVSWTEVARRVVERRVSYKDLDGNERSRSYKVPARVVTVAGEAPRLADWQLVARTETLADGSRLVHTVPGFEGRVDARFRSMSGQVCEHCKTERRRKDVYIVRHSDGREMQVGRTCLGDFTGSDSPERAASQMQWLMQVRDALEEHEGWTGGRWQDTHVDLREALALTSMYIRGWGWVPRSAGAGRPTADEVFNHFSSHGPNRDDAAKALREIGPVTDEDRQRAEETITWVALLSTREELSDYEQNLVQLVVGDLAETRHLGIVCSALATALRVKSRAEERRVQAEELRKSQHIGQVGERLQSCAVRVLAVREMQGRFGPTTLVKMLTQHGNLLTWFASGYVRVEPGHEATIKATIKRHSEYQGVQETQVTRVKGLEAGA